MNPPFVVPRPFRLTIQYNGESQYIPNGFIESFRCTSIKRAKEIVSRRDQRIIASAMFNDGVTYYNQKRKIAQTIK